MASSNNIHHIRSISLPSRSHPASLRVEEELYNLKTWEASASAKPTAETICSGLLVLESIYNSVNDLLSLPLTQQALSHSQHEKLVDELLERSLRLLDVCESTRDAMAQFKLHVRDVQSALRRRKGDSSIDASFMKKMKKDTKRTISALKQIDNKNGAIIALLDLDNHLSPVIRSLRDASAVSSSVFECILSFSSAFVSKPKSNKWSIVSKLIQKQSASKDQPQSSIESLDCDIEGIENDLECMFRSLIKTRASLLNIRSY